MRDGRVIGVILLARYETGGFDDTQIALMRVICRTGGDRHRQRQPANAAH